MQDDSDEPLQFPASDSIPELPSDDSLDELMLGPLDYGAITKKPIFISMNPPNTLSNTNGKTLSDSASTSPMNITLTRREKQDIKNRKAREKRRREKQQAEDSDEDKEGSRVTKKAKATKSTRRSKPKTAVFDESSDDEEPPKTFLVYFNIEGPKIAPSASRSKVQAPPPLVIHKGPFKHSTSDSFHSLQKRIAAETPCNVKLLALSQMYWKFEKPQNAPRKLMSNEMGYEALISGVKGDKKPDTVVMIFMPPPAKDLAWDTGDPDQVDEPFDYDQELADQHPEGLSRKDQMYALTQKSQSYVLELCAKYPINNAPEYPDKRVFKIGDRAWELTDLRLKVWAAHLINGGATLEQPPTSKHFNDDQKLRAPPKAPAPIPPVHVLPPVAPQWAPPYPWPQYAQPVHPQYAPPPYGQQPYGPPVYGYVPQEPPMQPLARTLPNSPLSSPGTAQALRVPLADFCARYHISDSNQQKLAELEYEPGNKMVESLDEKEWKHGAKFSALGWGGFLAAHRKFCRDIKNGAWD